MCCIYSLIVCRTFICRNMRKIFVYGLYRNKRKERTYVRHKITQICFPRIHRWRVLSRLKQQLAAGSLPNKRIHVLTVLPGMICAVSMYSLIICRTFIHQLRYVLHLFIDYLRNVHAQKGTKDLRERLILFIREKCTSTWYFEESMHVLLQFACNVYSTYYMFYDPYFFGCSAKSMRQNIVQQTQNI